MPGPLNAAVAVFARAPLAGRAKTRLIGRLSPEESAAFHRECVLATWDRLCGLVAIDAFLYCDRSWPEFEALAGRRRFRLQAGEDLGERMRNCLDDLLARGYPCALIVGSDAPTIPEAQIREAVDALGSAEVVLGASSDGGFTLIGAVRTARGMFREVVWSRPDTCKACLQALRSAGLKAVVTRSRSYDVDTPEDLERLRLDPALPTGLRRWFDNFPSGPS